MTDLPVAQGGTMPSWGKRDMGRLTFPLPFSYETLDETYILFNAKG
jgi:hypothetical protein